ncbi:MAG: c-type cytochrome [Candidatus Sulfotelmatobacter sp.]|jgi:mono/diheme cytochrome c family protein
MRPGLILSSLLLLSVAGLAQSSKDSGPSNLDRPARIPVEGAKIFQSYCAACHGADGRGHGPAAVALKRAPADLTLIAQRNHGRFPYLRIKQVITGASPGLLAHGDREMPIWGPIFHEIEADQDWGEVRIEAITQLLQSMQQK